MKSFLVIILSIFCTQMLVAQSPMRNSFSNYGGFFQAFNNPALAANNVLKFHTNTYAVNFDVANNYLVLDAPFSLREFITGNVPAQHKNLDGSINWQGDWVNENLDGQPKYGYLDWVSQGPSMLISGKRVGFALGIATTTSARVQNVSEDFIRLIRQKDYASLVGIDSLGNSIADNSFSMRAHSFMEFSGSLGVAVINKGLIRLRVGAGARYLKGLGYAELVNEGVSLKYYNQDSILLQDARFSVGYSNLELFDDFRSNLLNFNFIGDGLAFNFGATVDFSPKENKLLNKKTQYLLRFGVAISNFGSLKYNQGGKQFTADLRNPVVINPQDLAFKQAFLDKNSTGLAYLDSLVSANFDVLNEEKDLEIQFEETLQLTVDWNIFKGFYLGAVWNGPIQKVDKLAFNQFAEFLLIPRFESKIFEVMTPLTYWPATNSFTPGLYLRVGPAFVGTNNIRAVFEQQKASNAGFYVGVAFGVSREKDI